MTKAMFQHRLVLLFCQSPCESSQNVVQLSCTEGIGAGICLDKHCLPCWTLYSADFKCVVLISCLITLEAGLIESNHATDWTHCIAKVYTTHWSAPSMEHANGA